MRRLLNQAMKNSTLTWAGDNAERSAQLQQPLLQKQKHLSTRPCPLSSRPPSALVPQREVGNLRAQRRRALLMLPLQLQLSLLPPLTRHLHLHRMLLQRRRWRMQMPQMPQMPSGQKCRRLPLPH